MKNIKESNIHVIKVLDMEQTTHKQKHLKYS